MKEVGYVYILTNPSFKEDWVKIGKSARPVDIRSKELDNTAVPLPFEIYATLKTTKYSEAEKLIHHYIERFTNLRIRDNREFFNVKPEIALDIFKDVAQLLDDAEIEEVFKKIVLGGYDNMDPEEKRTPSRKESRAWILPANNKYFDLAKLYLNEAKNICYIDPEVHYLLAKCYIHEGDTEKAVKSLKTSVEKGYGYYPAKKLLENINMA